MTTNEERASVEVSAAEVLRLRRDKAALAAALEQLLVLANDPRPEAITPRLEAKKAARTALAEHSK